jgi:hypothetical protein
LEVLFGLNAQLLLNRSEQLFKSAKTECV